MGRLQKNWQVSRHMLQLLIINLVCWFFDVALAQEDVFANAFGSFDFPITCLVNMSVFMVTLIRGRLDFENGAREVLAALRGPKLEEINGTNGNGLTTIRMQRQIYDSGEGGGEDLQTASVVMLSNGAPNCSMKQFMESNAVDDVHSILLQYLPLKNARVNVTSCTISSFKECQSQGDVFAEAFGSFDFPITCLVNMSVFMVTLIRGRLDLENGAREVLGTLRAPKLEKINGINGMGLTTINTGDLQTASVVILSNGAPNCSMKQFMKSNAVNEVHSILLQYLPLNHVPLTLRNCEGREHGCKCIVFPTVEQITIMLFRRMSGPLKRVSDSMCLLPCLTCLNNSCHGSLDGFHPCQIDSESINAGQPICICIPMNDARHDKWTELLISSFKSKDDEARGVKVTASEALQEYLEERGRPNRQEVQEYNIGSFIWPRFSEILINIVLTFWFTVDGFSSSLAARRTVRDYLVDSKGSGLAANAFLTKTSVHTNNTKVCLVLTFRGNRVSFKSLSYIAGGVNFICFVGWAVLIAFKGDDIAPPLSIPRFAVMIAAIGIACFMDCLYMYSNWFFFGHKIDYKVLSVIMSEIVCIVAGSGVARTLGIKVFGKWVYSALQLLVWVKWVIGSCILDEYTPESSGYNDGRKVLVFSSAFLLNAALAGVRSKWTPSWPWKGA